MKVETDQIKITPESEINLAGQRNLATGISMAQAWFAKP